MSHDAETEVQSYSGEMKRRVIFPQALTHVVPTNTVRPVSRHANHHSLPLISNITQATRENTVGHSLIIILYE